MKLLERDSYLATLRQAAGSKMFRHVFALVNGQRRNLTANGKLSCAIFVSVVLLRFKLIKEPHLTVNGTIKDLRKSGWKKTRRLKPGFILVWQADKESQGHEHIGFYLGKKRALSNSSRTRTPIFHHWTYGTTNGRPKRRVIAIFRHPKFFS